MKKRVLKTIAIMLGMLLLLVLAGVFWIWFNFRSPEAMKRQGWDCCNSFGGSMNSVPGEQNFDTSCMFVIDKYSMYRLETDSVINKGSIIVSIYRLEDYDDSITLSNVRDEQKVLLHEYVIEESAIDIFDFSEYDDGGYFINISRESEDTDAYCYFTFKTNLYIWQSRYNSLVTEHPKLKKILDIFGIYYDGM